MKQQKKTAIGGFFKKIRRTKGMTYEQKCRQDEKRLKKLKKENKRFSAALLTVVIHIKAFLKKCTQDNVNALSGQSTFFLILSAVPLLMFLMTIIVFLGFSPDSNAVQKAASETVVGQAAGTQEYTVLSDFIIKIVREVYEHASSGTFIITAVMALWSAGKGMYIITDGISRIYRLEQKHTWLLRRIFAMGYTAVLLLMMVLLIGVLVFSSVAEAFISRAINIIPASAELLYGLRYVITTVVLALFMTLALKLYLLRKVDDKRYAKFRVLLPGMIFTAVAWDVLAWGVNLYSRHFTSSIYGSLGTVFIMMMWIYFMMLFLLYGVQIDYVYREQFYDFSFRKAFSKLRKKLKKTA